MNDFLRIRFRTCLRISKDRRKIISNSSLAINYYTQSVFLFLVFVWSTCRYSFFFFSSLQFIENISRTGSTMTSASLRYPKPKVDRARRRSREEGRERKRFFLPGVPYRAIIIVVVIFLFFFFFFSILPNRGGESGETGTVYLNERCASPLLFRFPFVPRFENRLRKSTRLPTASNFRLEDSTSAKKKFDPNSLKCVSSSLCNSFFFLFFFWIPQNFGNWKRYEFC